MTSIRAQTRAPWGPSIGPNQAAAGETPPLPGFQAMPGQIRTRPPTAQSQVRPNAINSARPITGQSMAPATRGVAMPNVRPQGPGVGQQRPAGAGYPGARGQAIAQQPGRPMQQSQ